MSPEIIAKIISDAQAGGASTLEIMALIAMIGWLADKVWYHRDRRKNGKKTSTVVQCAGAVPLEAKIGELAQTTHFEHESIKEGLNRIEGKLK